MSQSAAAPATAATPAPAKDDKQKKGSSKKDKVKERKDKRKFGDREKENEKERVKQKEESDLKLLTKEIVSCDGSLLEGGGQVLRNSMAYAALLNRGIRITKIRAGREVGGLRPQHCTGIKLIHEIFGGVLTNAKVKSTDITFVPGSGQFTHVQKQPNHEMLIRFEADPGTAGSTGLLVQISLPTLIYLPYPTKLTVRGGTDAIKAPLAEYSISVFLPVMRRLFGLPKPAIDLQLKMRGFFPKGGGLLELNTRPLTEPLQGFELMQRGTVTSIHGLAVVSGRISHTVAEKMAEAATKKLQKSLRKGCGAVADPVTFHIIAKHEHPSVSPFDGASILIWAETDKNGCRFGGSAIGKKGVPPETVGEEAADELLAHLAHGGCVDEWLQDQLIIFMALAQGRSLLRTGPLSLHTQTAIHWATELAGAKFTVKPYAQWFRDQQTIAPAKTADTKDSKSTPPAAAAAATTTASGGTSGSGGSGGSSAAAAAAAKPAFNAAKYDAPSNPPDQSFVIECVGIGYQSRFKPVGESASATAAPAAAATAGSGGAPMDTTATATAAAAAGASVPVAAASAAGGTATAANANANNARPRTPPTKK